MADYFAIIQFFMIVFKSRISTDAIDGNIFYI